MSKACESGFFDAKFGKANCWKTQCCLLIFAWLWHDLQTVCAVQKCSVVHWSLMLWQPLQLPPIKWGPIVDEQVRLHCLMWHQNLLYLTSLWPVRAAFIFINCTAGRAAGSWAPWSRDCTQGL
jgi:hypothetical protein